MTCMNGKQATETVTITEGDDLPAWIAGFDFEITGYTVTALVERPDGTGFERVGVPIDSTRVQFNWTPTDWIDGCSQFSIKTEIGGQSKTSGPVVVNVRPKPDTTP